MTNKFNLGKIPPKRLYKTYPKNPYQIYTFSLKFFAISLSEQSFYLLVGQLIFNQLLFLSVLQKRGNSRQIQTGVGSELVPLVLPVLAIAYEALDENHRVVRISRFHYPRDHRSVPVCVRAPALIGVRVDVRAKQAVFRFSRQIGGIYFFVELGVPVGDEGSDTGFGVSEERKHV